LNFRRTPTIEASLIYGVALILGVLLFAAIAGWKSALQLSQISAILLMFPTWLLMVLIGVLTRKRKTSKFSRFFFNVSVIAFVSVVCVALLFPVASTAVARSSLTAMVAVYFISNLVASVLTQFVFFGNWTEPKQGADYGAIHRINPSPAKTAKSKKKK
jgi:ABC-type transport system involved in cytochrome c biogenesis permease subunit